MRRSPRPSKAGPRRLCRALNRVMDLRGLLVGKLLRMASKEEVRRPKPFKSRDRDTSNSREDAQLPEATPGAPAATSDPTPSAGGSCAGTPPPPASLRRFRACRRSRCGRRPCGRRLAAVRPGRGRAGLAGAVERRRRGPLPAPRAGDVDPRGLFRTPPAPIPPLIRRPCTAGADLAGKGHCQRGCRIPDGGTGPVRRKRRAIRQHPVTVLGS